MLVEKRHKLDQIRQRFNFQALNHSKIQPKPRLYLNDSELLTSTIALLLMAMVAEPINTFLKGVQDAKRNQ